MKEVRGTLKEDSITPREREEGKKSVITESELAGRERKKEEIKGGNEGKSRIDG